MASAPDFESGGWGFESLRDRFAITISAIGLVVKYLVANEVPRVRFPDGAFLAFVAQLAARGSHNPKVAGSTPVESILALESYLHPYEAKMVVPVGFEPTPAGRTRT